MKGLAAFAWGWGWFTSPQRANLLTRAVEGLNAAKFESVPSFLDAGFESLEVLERQDGNLTGEFSVLVKFVKASSSF